MGGADLEGENSGIRRTDKDRGKGKDGINMNCMINIMSSHKVCML
jgi:hypothetical protein